MDNSKSKDNLSDHETSKIETETTNIETSKSIFVSKSEALGFVGEKQEFLEKSPIGNDTLDTIELQNNLEIADKKSEPMNFEDSEEKIDDSKTNGLETGDSSIEQSKLIENNEFLQTEDDPLIETNNSRLSSQVKLKNMENDPINEEKNYNENDNTNFLEKITENVDVENITDTSKKAFFKKNCNNLISIENGPIPEESEHSENSNSKTNLKNTRDSYSTNFCKDQKFSVNTQSKDSILNNTYKLNTTGFLIESTGETKPQMNRTQDHRSPDFQEAKGFDQNNQLNVTDEKSFKKANFDVDYSIPRGENEVDVNDYMETLEDKLKSIEELQNRLKKLDIEKEKNNEQTSEKNDDDQQVSEKNDESNLDVQCPTDRTPIDSPKKPSVRSTEDSAKKENDKKPKKKERVPLFKRAVNKQPVVEEIYKELDDLGLDYTDIVPTFAHLFTSFYHGTFDPVHHVRDIYDIFYQHVETIRKCGTQMLKITFSLTPMELSYFDLLYKNDQFRLYSCVNKTMVSWENYCTRQNAYINRLNEFTQKDYSGNTESTSSEKFLYFRVVKNKSEVYNIISRTFYRRNGWRELPHGLNLKTSWNLLWTWSKPQIDPNKLIIFQKVNHFFSNKYLARKD